MGEMWEFRELCQVGVGVFDCEHKTPVDAGNGFPYIAIPNLVDGRVDLANVRSISADDLIVWTRRFEPTPGDIIVTRRGRVGDSAALPAGIRCAIGQNLIILRSDGSLIDQGYLRWATRGPLWLSEVDRVLNVGAIFSSLNVSDIPRIRIPVPPKQVQNAISRVLSALDDKIVVNEQIVAISRELALTMFRSNIQDDPIEREVAEISSLVTRGVAPRYSEDESQLMVLNQKCIREGRVLIGPARRTLEEKVPEQKWLRQGDVLVNSTGVGTLGRVARWTFDAECTVDSHVTIVRFDEAKYDPVCAGFAMLLAQQEIEMLGEGSTGQTELSRVKLGRFPLRLPSKRKAMELRPRLDALEAQSDVLLAESTALTELRDTLLPRLMSGELRVREAEKMVEGVV